MERKQIVDLRKYILENYNEIYVHKIHKLETLLTLQNYSHFKTNDVGTRILFYGYYQFLLNDHLNDFLW